MNDSDMKMESKSNGSELDRLAESRVEDDLLSVIQNLEKEKNEVD